MRKILSYILLFLSISVLSAQTTYYIGAGETYETIADANGISLSAGDSVLFHRGEIFKGSIAINYSGTQADRVVIGVYGEGDKPIITGWDTISDWTEQTAGLYYSVVAMNQTLVDDVAYQSYTVKFNGDLVARGREPDSGWWTYESSSTNVSITDNELSSSPDWTGAEAVIRTVKWWLDRCPISEHSTTTLTHTGTGSWSYINGYGYFVQAHKDACDQLGEWHYDGDTLFMYFGAENPADHEVFLSTYDYGIRINYKDYQTYENLDIQGYNVSGIYIADANPNGTDSLIIKDCNISYTNGVGILAPSSTYYADVTIDGCSINNVAQSGIGMYGTGTWLWAKNNIIDSIGLIPGNWFLNANGDEGDGIAFYGANSIVEYNKLSNVGHSGIRFSAVDGAEERTGTNIKVRYNLVNGFGYTRYDAAGIYAWANNTNADVTGWKVNNNIVLNSKQTADGIGTETHLSLWGLYTDENADKLEWRDNTASNCFTAGQLLYRADSLTVVGNTLYNNGQFQFQIANYYSPYVTGSRIDSNLFIAKNETQFSSYFWANSATYDEYGTSDYNYYGRLIGTNTDVAATKSNFAADTTENTLSEWATLTGNEANSTSFINLVSTSDSIRFEYNATNTNKLVGLSYPMQEVDGTYYVYNVTLEPYTSKVLFPKYGIKATPHLSVGGNALSVGNKILKF